MDYNSLHVAIQPVPSPSNSPIALQFSNQHVLEYHEGSPCIGSVTDSQFVYGNLAWAGLPLSALRTTGQMVLLSFTRDKCVSGSTLMSIKAFLSTAVNTKGVYRNPISHLIRHPEVNM